MWNTSEGVRVLERNEAALFKQGVTSWLASGMPVTGVGLFDELSQDQKVAVLFGVAQALLQEGVSSPELTAINEAAIGAIYEHIDAQVDREIEGGGRPVFRRLVVECVRADLEAEGERPPDADSTDKSEWPVLVVICADKILYDRDFDMAYLFLDEQPEKAAALRDYFGISEDYYRAVPPAEAKKLLIRLKRLIASGK